MMNRLALAPLALAMASAFAADKGADYAALGEVTVTATREGQLVAETPASVSLIKDKALREATAKQRAQLIQAVLAAAPAENAPVAPAGRPRGTEGSR